MMGTRGNRIFLSVGRQKDDRHARFVAKIRDMLEMSGIVVTQLPNSYENPLDRVVQELRQSDGALIICFERLYAKQAIEFRTSDKPGPEFKPFQAPTIWNHVESALAKAANVPVLILAEKGVRPDGMLDPVVQFKVHWMDFDDRLLSETYFRQLFNSWLDAVSSHSAKPKQIENVGQLRVLDVIRGMKVTEIVAVCTGIGSIFAAGLWLGMNLPK
jgi:hypothetical protein